MVTSENNVEQDIAEETETDYLREEKIAKLFKISKIAILVSLTIFWIVTIVLGLISLWNEEGILDTPWVIFGLVLTVIVIIFVIIPLYRSLKVDIRLYNEEKAEKEKLEKQFNELENKNEI